MEYTAELAADIQKVWELIKDIKIAMLVTDENGTLRSRPMATQTHEFDGKLWFFTKEPSPKTDELEKKETVNVAFADPDHQRYISISGKAHTVRDHKKMAELWHPSYKAWFSEGLSDPEIALIRVDVESVEYWTAPSSKVIQLFAVAKATLTGKEYDAGTHDKISLH